MFVIRSTIRSFQINSRRLLAGKVVIPGNQSSFDQLASKGGKMIFYYTATWCPPCRAIAPVYEKLSENYPDITFTKIDVDQLPDAASAASIRSVPTFILKNDGKKITEFSGADATRLESAISSLNKL